jgi:Ala-tRNA(Pro) deacylase
MPMRPRLDCLNRPQVQYLSISHSPAYTAQAIAAPSHMPGNELANTVIVQLNGTLAVAVRPASEPIDVDR